MRHYLLSITCLLIMSLSLPAECDELVGLTYWNEISKPAVTTDSGLQYKVQIMGKGRLPSKGTKISVHYRGLLLNGVVFDSSYNSDEPIKMNLRTVIEGWKEGIRLMPVGSVFVFLIPPELAYGDKSSDGIPRNSTLIFEVELYASN